MKFKVVTHYAEDDPDFDGDYTSQEIFDENGNKVAEFADSYHEKKDPVGNFLKGIEYGANAKIEIELVKIADGDY